MRTISTFATVGTILALAGGLLAAKPVEVVVNDIPAGPAVTWTADKVYDLQKPGGRPIRVLPGATLIIEPGTIIATTPGDDQGALAVCRGGMIFINGTEDKPVVMTSTNDRATWVDPNDPTKGGTWREACVEWGSLALMGRGRISASHYEGQPVVIDGVPNPKVANGQAQKRMEGLSPVAGEEPLARYGGADDNDDSGEIHYLSLRYGGFVLAFADELNGLSLGGIGRETDIDHIDIMNNVDDGIELWGGTVNLKYVNIWNIGDDSLDFDEGWRGKAQFGLIVQGYSIKAKQGSGTGDNCFEHDGAEDSDAQPVSTAVIYNFTAVGLPFYEGFEGDPCDPDDDAQFGDQGTAWRDNARVQYHNCVWIDIGDKVVKNDGDDGDGANGYGYNGTLTFDQTWAQPYTYSHDPCSTVNLDPNWNVPGSGSHPEVLYQAQTSHKLAGIWDSVMYGYKSLGHVPSGIDLADANYNCVLDPDKTGAMPIKGLTRAAEFVTDPGLGVPGYIASGKYYLIKPVTNIDPRAAGPAVESVNCTAPDDGFFTPVSYRGGFSPFVNWCDGWTAASQFGFMQTVGGEPAEDPASTGIKMTSTVSFPTEEGVIYTVEESTDGQTWTPVGVVTGTGEEMSVTDLEDFDNAKLYRVIAQ